MVQSSKQLTLKLTQQEIYKLDNFLFDDAALQDAVQAFYRQDNLPFLYLCGAPGTGKTHLSLGIANALEAADISVCYLNLQELTQSVVADSLTSLSNTQVVCFDDVEAIAGHADWEEALFHVFNELRLRQAGILMATQHPPAQLTVNLPDLRSRLASALVFQLHDMAEPLKQKALMMQAQSRGLVLSEEVAQYLLRHFGRDMPSLMAVLQQLDHASLAAQRRLTIPFVREVLDWPINRQ